MFKDLKYLILIIAIFIAGCIETDIYLPAFTDMMRYFAISEEKIQELLTWNFIAVCISGPFYGPISDAIGRRKPLVFALGVFLLGSLFTVYADNFSLMLIGRVLQGIGCGGCFVLGTAILFDLFEGDKAMHALNKINSIVPFIMAAAPILGGYLNIAFGFRSNFIAIAACVLVSFLITLFFLKEPLAKEKWIPLDLPSVFNKFKEVGKSLPFWQTVWIVSLIFAGYLAFLSCISVLFVLEMGVDKQYLPYFQGALLGAWLLANLTFKFFVNHLSASGIKKWGLILFSLGGLLTLLSACLAPKNPYYVTFGMVLYAMGANWIQAIYFPEGMQIFPELKGITSSFLTSARLLITATVVALVSHAYDATIFPIAYAIFGIVAAMLINIAIYEKKRQPISVVEKKI